ncbi:folylpolyglutamate synthase/dihydrofolate synthase family protein [Algivirga pacifica]|uniref:Dihydrofolate synthase/folylpolyglutamate synthase n=1 Tax=Algivirga pacifica TaxID=1162670 RepID=A0ABP9DC43_9BACT
MNYEQALEYMYSQLPMYQRVGGTAFKKDLTNTLALCEAMGNPQKKFKSIHIGGTNGKGSSSSFTAAILQRAGYKVGLYTSPHLQSFTERIRVNGQNLPEKEVVQFVEQYQELIEEVKPSFFEMTVAMAFEHFAKEQVDYAVIEVGLGGRLDSTNVIEPEACLITNIGMDHMDMLGDTPQAIAAEKAGIIKSKTPVVISQTQKEVSTVFMDKAKEVNAPITFGDRKYTVRDGVEGTIDVYKDGMLWGTEVNVGLKGKYQYYNLPGVLKLIDVLNPLLPKKIKKDDIIGGLENVVKLTAVKGRWQQLGTSPQIFCDVGHNEEGIKEIIKQIGSLSFQKLHMVLGVVKEKDLSKILTLLPEDATYYFCTPKVPRGLSATELQKAADQAGLKGIVIEDVKEAVATAKQEASVEDLIFIGGSTFVVAELDL